jgi:hypothetical protein
MARIRHKGTGAERNVPDEAVPYFPDYTVVKSEAPAADKSQPSGEKSTAKTSKETP